MNLKFFQRGLYLHVQHQFSNRCHLIYFLILVSACSSGCAKIIGASSVESPPVEQVSHVFERGVASVYERTIERHLTASGEPFRNEALTAAHRNFPFGAYLLVFNKSNGKKVVVRVNDRGPFIAGRVLDLSPLAASKIGFGKEGLMPVDIFKTQAPVRTLGSLR